MFPKKERELETLIQTVRIQSRHRSGIWHKRMRYASNESGKRHMTEGIEPPNQEISEYTEKRKTTNTWKYWKLAPSNKWR